MNTTPELDLPAKRPLLIVLFIALLCLATAGQANAQEQGLTLRANYPLTVGDTFLSNYDGVIGAGLVYNQPLFSSLLLRPAVEYERLNLEVPTDRDLNVTANAYTARLGLGYPIDLIRDVDVIPEIGIGYTRIGFESGGDDVTEDDDAGDPQNSFSTWVAVNPRYALSNAVEIGASFGYRAAFLETPEGALDTPYNRQLHALTFGATLTYNF